VDKWLSNWLVEEWLLAKDRNDHSHSDGWGVTSAVFHFTHFETQYSNRIHKSEKA